MPTSTASTVYKWTCARCKKSNEVNTESTLTPRPPEGFSGYQATIRVNSVSKDFQGVAVGPGPLHSYDTLDLCDECFGGLLKFWEGTNDEVDKAKKDRSLVTTEPAEKNTKGGYRSGKSASEMGPPSQV